MAVARGKDGRLMKGSVLNPKGRPRGSRDRLTEVKQAFVQAFEELGGVGGLVEWVLEDKGRRGEFYRLIVNLLPRDLTLEAIDSRRSAIEYDTSELVAMSSEFRIEAEQPSPSQPVLTGPVEHDDS